MANYYSPSEYGSSYDSHHSPSSHSHQYRSPLSDPVYPSYYQDEPSSHHHQQQPPLYRTLASSPRESQSPDSDASYSPASSYSPVNSRHGVMVCLFQGCSYTCPRKADLERHVKVTHNRGIIPLVSCEWPGCHRKGNLGFTRTDKMRDHLRDVHKADIAKRQSGRRG